ncbi:hypothetical protein ExPCM14_02531 [Escherichia coli]|nr:hypothetical protein ExPCM14_02531 [Escherichia coli]
MCFPNFIHGLIKIEPQLDIFTHAIKHDIKVDAIKCQSSWQVNI